MKNRNKLTKEFLKEKESSSPIPAKLFDLGLDSCELSILVYFITCGETFNPSLSLVQRKVNVSRPTAIRAIKSLIDRGIISHAGYGMNGTKLYKFNEPKNWLTSTKF